MSTFKDVYQTVTTQIIEAIENGSAEYRMPWHSIGTSAEEPVNVASKRPYRGVNVISLWAAALARGYVYGLWGTYKQWQGVGAQVRKGESGTCVVLWKSIDKSDGDEDEEKRENSSVCLARGFSVFNVAQVEGYRMVDVPRLSERERSDRAEDFYAALGVEVRHGGNRAYYNITEDHIVLPPFEVFRSAVSYYATLAHEMTHWTGAAHRLARDFGSRERLEARAFEELVAELGAAFLCARLELPTERRLDHAAYVKSWLVVLKQDKRAIFRAASTAQKASDWLCSQAFAIANAA